ncbi:MAG: acyl-CoA thioesterase-2 [Flavobacteriales bacterium]|jgi:acyl-CoA thioesterase-2
MKLFNLDQVTDLIFIGRNHHENFRKSLFGGQVLGQALKACSMTIADKSPHSLHAYFLRAGNSLSPVEYHVERVRDGRSISNRRVIARQDEQEIFHLSASFHYDEEGYSHQSPESITIPDTTALLKPTMPDDPHLNGNDLKPRATGPFEILPVGDVRIDSPSIQPAHAQFWIRLSRDAKQKDSNRFAALAYSSDFGLLASALLPHPATLFDSTIIAASIDHAMWFHSNDFCLNEWMLCSIDSPWAGNARGFSRGQLHTQSGRLIASTAQEGLIRPIDG